MKTKFALMLTALTAGTALATTAPAPAPAAEAPAPAPVATAPDFATLPALSKERLDGSFTLGAATNYSGKGYVISRAVSGGEGVVMSALKLNYDIGKYQDYWTLNSTIAYKAPTSSHTLYPPYTKKNIENEFAVITGAKYKQKLWNVSMGHQFVHGGLYGVMAKHFRKQGASTTNEVFLAPEWTPAPWFAAGVKASLSFQGLHGWWFEPYMTFKAPIIGTPDDIKLAGVVTFSMSATTEYYNEGDFACSNGSQAFVIQLSTPWYVKKNIILTPSVGFHWLGKGGMKANEKSHVKKATGNSDYVPFKNFGVVGTLTATYTF